MEGAPPVTGLGKNGMGRMGSNGTRNTEGEDHGGKGFMNTVYEGDGGTTEWDDIQRKLGNYAPKPKPTPAPEYTPDVEEQHDTAWVDKRDEAELLEAEDEFADDQFMEEYRQRRIRELQSATLRPRFGSVEEIRGSEFVTQVTNAGQDVHVVVHLYKDAHGGSALAAKCLSELAPKYPSTKFLKIISTDCIPKYPDANLPTLLLYHNGVCLKHVAGIAAIGGARTTPEQVAMKLNMYGSFCVEGADEDAAAAEQVRSLVQRMIEQKEAEAGGGDQSSDFDD